jgi:IS6 family transposase
MNAFKLRRFHALVILQCVRWYSKYTISHRQLEEMMAERGVVVDHTTIWRWNQHYAPRLEKGEGLILLENLVGVHPR